jgi:hypothetical protein
MQLEQDHTSEAEAIAAVRFAGAPRVTRSFDPQGLNRVIGHFDAAAMTAPPARGDVRSVESARRRHANTIATAWREDDRAAEEDRMGRLEIAMALTALTLIGWAVLGIIAAAVAGRL